MAETGSCRDDASTVSSTTSVFNGVDRELARHLEEVKFSLENDLEEVVKLYKALKKNGKRENNYNRRVGLMEKFQDLVKRLKEWREEYVRAGENDFSLVPMSRRREREGFWDH